MIKNISGSPKITKSSLISFLYQFWLLNWYRAVPATTFRMERSACFLPNTKTLFVCVPSAISIFSKCSPCIQNLAIPFFLKKFCWDFGRSSNFKDLQFQAEQSGIEVMTPHDCICLWSLQIQWDQWDKRFPEPLQKQKLKSWEDSFRYLETVLPCTELSFKLCMKKEVEAAQVKELVSQLYMQNNHS